MSRQIQAVYQRALVLRQCATESPVQPNLLENAFSSLIFVLEELQSSEEELQRQNQTLLATRKQVEVERQRYQELFHLAPHGYLVTSTAGIIQEANQAIAAMLKVSQAYIIGKPLVVFMVDEVHPAFYEKLSHLNASHPSTPPKIQDWEVQIWPRQGPPLDVAISASIIPTPNSGSFLWLFHDITQQKQVTHLLKQLNTAFEQEVQERTTQLQQALDFEKSVKHITEKVRDSLDEQQILQTVVQELTQALDIISCEIRFYDLDTGVVTTCYRSSRADTANALPIVASSQVISIPTFPEGYRQLLQGQDFQFCEITPNQALTRVTILICPIADEQTVIGGLYLFKPTTETFGDSEIRLVQQVANQCTIAIRQAHLYQASQQQVQEFENLYQLKNNFLSNISHELRTPLSQISMTIQLLDLILKQPEQFEARQQQVFLYLEILHSACQQEIELINNLLDLAELDATAKSLELTSLNLNAWLPDVIAPFEERIPSQQQQLQVNIATDIPPLTTDASVLKRILTELLNNACKYTPQGEAIVVAVNTTDQGVRISISNSGINLPSQELDRLFDKFYRVPTHDPWKHGGTGLGLALVKQQAERIRGTITVTNPQPWIVFMLQLPWQID